jgi:hypothetical protein
MNHYPFIDALTIFAGLLVLPYGNSYSENRANSLVTDISNQTSLLSNSTESGKNETFSIHLPQKQLTVPLGILVLTVVAIVVSDFCADGLQNPSRAYLLDVCPEGRVVLCRNILLA